jgi:tRNA A-37 threonylcarbamoyl transferase component Bud32
MLGSEGLPPGSIPVRCGEVLAGKYRIDRVLGVGGMGVVVAATHLQLDQRVALKFMLPEALQVPLLLERFAREARAAVRLKSDHVARVLDVGTLESGSPYMVMEYLEGHDLGSMIETRGALPVETAVDFVLQACDAVAEAHSVGIVHRDLKPRNLFVTQRNDGRALVKVLDFGIAKHTASSGVDLSLTKTTDVIGSPNYMSPEQLRASKSTDERSDIWALGVILYELLTGGLPFNAESVTQLIAMVLSDDPRPIREVRTDVPADLERVIERCLRKDPAARFASVAELAAALEPFAPPDTRGLATRIARITSGNRLVAPHPAGATAPGPVPTTANWSAKAHAAASTRGKAMAVVAVSSVSLAIAVVGAFGVLRLTRKATLPPAGLATSSVPSAMASQTLAPMAAGASVSAPMPDTPTKNIVVGGAPRPGADGGSGAPARMHREITAPIDSAPSSEPPKYRTSW